MDKHRVGCLTAACELLTTSISIQKVPLSRYPMGKLKVTVADGLLVPGDVRYTIEDKWAGDERAKSD